MKTNKCISRTQGRFIKVLALFLAAVWTSVASAANVSWTGNYDSNWDDSRNWSPSVVPGVGDDVVIHGGSISAGGNRTVRSLSMHDASLSNLATLSATTLSVSGSAWISGESASLNQLNVSGGTIIITSITLSGSSTWSGGRLERCSVEITPEASVSIPSGMPDLAHTTLTNRGTVALGGQLRGWENAIIENHGTWFLSNSATPFTSVYSGNIFNNNGVLHKSGTAPVTTLANTWTFNLNNKTRVDTGILSLTATVNLVDGARLSGAGTIDINGPTHLSGVVIESIANLRLDQSGHLICTETASFTGTLTWIHGTISGTFNVAPGSSLKIVGPEIHRLNAYAGISNHGLIRWSGSGPLDCYEDNLVHNHSEGTFEIAADGIPFRTVYGGSQLLNDGLIVRSTGNDFAIIQSLPFQNNGTLTCNSGNLELRSFSNLNAGSSLAGSSTILLNGDIRMNGTVSETVNSLRMTGNNLTGANSCQLVGSLEVEGGHLFGRIGIPQGSIIAITGEGFKRLSANSRIDVYGELRWEGPHPLQFYENSVIQIHPNGVGNLVADGDPFDSVYGGNEIIVEGTLVKSAGEGDSTICDSPTIRHRGNIRCHVSTLVFTNVLYFEENGVITGDGNIRLEGAMHLHGTVTVNAPATWTAGTLNGAGGILGGILEWTGGISSGNWEIGDEGRLRISDGIGTLKRLNGSAVLNVSGILEMASGTLQTYENTRINIRDGGKMEGTGSTSVTAVYGGNVVEVRPGGLLTTSATGELRFDNQVLNHGLVEPAAGILSCNGGGGPSTGTFHADPGATLLFTGGTHELDATSRITGNGEIRVTGGLVKAMATVSGRVHLDGGTLEGMAPDGEFRFLSGSNWSNGFLTGRVSVPAGATLSVDGSDPGLRRLNFGAELSISGIVKVTGAGPIQAYEKNTVEVRSGGVLEMATDGLPFSAVYGSSRFTNHGIIVKSGGTGDSVFQSLPCFSDGTIECRSGRIAINSNFTFNQGNTITGAGRTVLTGGRTTLNGTTVVNSSTLELAGAELLGSSDTPGVLSGQNFEWSVGSISGVVTLDGFSTITTVGLHRINFRGEVRNSGVCTLGVSSSVQCYEQATLRNLADGTMTTEGASSVSRVYGGNLFVNEGTLNIGSPTGTLTVSPSFEQTASGRLVVGVAGIPDAFDRFVVHSTATLAGTLVANLESGFNPAPGTSFEVVDAYTRVGTFSQVSSPRFDVTYPVAGNPPVSQNNVVLVVREGSGLSYETWADDHSLTGNEALPGADPDKDGNDNFTEYALNMNPLTKDALPLRQSVEAYDSINWIMLRYRIWDTRTAAGVRYIPETSTNLIDWEETGMIDEMDPLAPVINGSEARLCRVPLGEARRFIHLRFSKP